MSQDQAKLIEWALRALPYPEQIRNISTEGNDTVRLTWRGNPLQLSKGPYVNTVGGEMLVGDDLSLLVRTLLQRVMIDDMNEERRNK